MPSPARSPRALPGPFRLWPLAFLAAAAVTACSGGAQLATKPHPLLDQAVAPRRELGLDGGPLTLPAPGRVTVVDFWETSCAPCVAMMPALESLWLRKRGAGVSVVGLAGDDNPGLVQERLRSLGITYPNVVDPDGRVRGAYRVAVVPTTIVVDRHGRVRLARMGADPGDLAAIRDAVDTLLGEP